MSELKTTTIEIKDCKYCKKPHKGEGRFCDNCTNTHSFRVLLGRKLPDVKPEFKPSVKPEFKPLEKPEFKPSEKPETHPIKKIESEKKEINKSVNKCKNCFKPKTNTHRLCDDCHKLVISEKKPVVESKPLIVSDSKPLTLTPTGVNKCKNCKKPKTNTHKFCDDCHKLVISEKKPFVPTITEKKPFIPTITEKKPSQLSFDKKIQIKTKEDKIEDLITIVRDGKTVGKMILSEFFNCYGNADFTKRDDVIYLK